MSQLLQADAINMARAEADDSYEGKVVNNYSPQLGNVDGINVNFQIPVQRVVVQYLEIFKNNNPLVPVVDFNISDPIAGGIVYTVAPLPDDSYIFNIFYTWATDVEVDHYLNRAANELGYGTYHTDYPGTVTNSEVIQSQDQITDFPAGLKAALIYGAASKYCSALVLRFGQKYDVSAGDKHYSPSQMAQAYEKRAGVMQKQFLTARDDFYKGQGTQYRPSIQMQGYVLPSWTPKR